MSIFLLHWAVFLFMVGLLLSLPLGAVYYLKSTVMKQSFPNPRKLKAAHLDFFMQAFSIGLICLLEVGMNAKMPVYAIVPLAFGTFCNPLIFLLEATPLYQKGVNKVLYQVLKAASPPALFFAWFVILLQFLPLYFLWMLGTFVITLTVALVINRMRKENQIPDKEVVPSEKSM